MSAYVHLVGLQKCLNVQKRESDPPVANIVIRDARKAGLHFGAICGFRRAFSQVVCCLLSTSYESHQDADNWLPSLRSSGLFGFP